jgi:hypothetical protein
MKLYLISQDENNDYDTYDSAVVAAPDEDTARNINPRATDYDTDLFVNWNNIRESTWFTWASKPEDVKVKYLGEAVEGTPLGVVLTSFNAG